MPWNCLHFKGPEMNYIHHYSSKCKEDNCVNNLLLAFHTQVFLYSSWLSQFQALHWRNNLEGRNCLKWFTEIHVLNVKNIKCLALLKSVISFGVYFFNMKCFQSSHFARVRNCMLWVRFLRCKVISNGFIIDCDI